MNHLRTVIINYIRSFLYIPLDFSQPLRCISINFRYLFAVSKNAKLCSWYLLLSRNTSRAQATARFHLNISGVFSVVVVSPLGIQKFLWDHVHTESQSYIYIYSIHTCIYYIVIGWKFSRNN